MTETEPRGVVLIVDDSPETLHFLIDALEGAGLAALVARDGSAALALLERITPDVILLDLVMPGIGGFELCRLIKARNALATVPVVFVTGLGDTGNVVEGLRAGGVDYLVKPIHPDELIARISNHVANARLIAQAREAVDAASGAVVALRPDCRPAWLSPRAHEVLVGALGEGWERHLQEMPALAGWLAEVERQPVSRTGPLVLALDPGVGLQLAAIGRSATGEILARLTAPAAEQPAARLARALTLTARESDVLLWLARGKSNRDIATILALSPRTVTKHVEQIFAKLGVENRTSAAILALRHLDA